MREGARALARLTARQRLVALRCAALALAVETSLRTSTLPKTARRFGSRLALDPGEAEGGDPRLDLTPRELEALAVARQVLTRGPFNGTCLRQALLQGHLLRRRHPVLRVGVAKVDGAVTAHAWLEVAGAPLDPSGASAFEPLRTPTRPRSAPACTARTPPPSAPEQEEEANGA